jgi:broad specificity phosphatase PhoE
LTGAERSQVMLASCSEPLKMKSQRMNTVYFITHPDVVIDPATPVAQWPLSQRGRMRMLNMLEHQWISRVGAIYCSTEQKAMDGAAIISEVLEIPYTAIPELRENDRSAIGYLSEPELDAVVDEFFRRPEESVRGWERAVDAQRRIVPGTKAVLRAKPVDGDVAIVAHGGTGTLLLCHLAGVPISRDWDQPRTNGGNYFAFDLMTFRLLHGWRSIDTQHVASYQKREDRTK